MRSQEVIIKQKSLSLKEDLYWSAPFRFTEVQYMAGSDVSDLISRLVGLVCLSDVSKSADLALSTDARTQTKNLLFVMSTVDSNRVDLNTLKQKTKY